jgi:mannosylglycerate hydrolase
VGVAFLNDGLTEYEVIENAERTVALSLIRGVRNWVCTEMRVGSDWPSQKGGQAMGQHAIRYAIRPHAGDWAAANIPLAAELFNVPMRLVQTRVHEGALPPRQAALFAIDNPALRFSALKKTEDHNSFVVRLYNPTNERQRAKLHFNAEIIRAWYTNLNEKRGEALVVGKSNTIAIAAGPQKIVTVEVKTK